MPKTLLKQTFNGDITVVDGVKKLTGIAIVDHFEVVDEDNDTHIKQVSRTSPTAEDLALLLGDEVANLTSANATLTAQNATLQSEKAAVDAQLREANDQIAQLIAARDRIAQAAMNAAAVAQAASQEEAPAS